MVSGRTMVPIRFIAESFGATIDYDSANRRVTIVYVKR
ncbi:MAG TPA: stalk domain-containing protein [Caldisericia bacterium]|nr:stalk domain-containing protein [Caldisericia bacterium]